MRNYEASRDNHAISVVIGQYFLVGKTKRGNRPHVLSKNARAAIGIFKVERKLQISYNIPKGQIFDVADCELLHRCSSSRFQLKIGLQVFA